MEEVQVTLYYIRMWAGAIISIQFMIAAFIVTVIGQNIQTGILFIAFMFAFAWTLYNSWKTKLLLERKQQGS